MNPEAIDPGQPPVIIVGGDAGALSLVRAYARNGITCYLLTKRGLHVGYSRHARVLPWDGPEQWARFLLGDESDWLRGALLLAGDDDRALRLIASDREVLQAKFLLDLMNPESTHVMLDKLLAYRRARDCGIAVPEFLEVQTLQDVEIARETLRFPVLLKPRFSPSFRMEFHRKFLMANNEDEVIPLFQYIRSRGDFAILLLEMIPGPDSLIASYYTYVDEHGRCLFDFTKTILRRLPVNEGYATYHIARRMPEVAALGRHFLECCGYRGIAGVELKCDPRDGQWKLIECNARFTAPTELLQAAKCDVAMLVYNRAVGRPVVPFVQSGVETRLWLPLEDFRSFLMLRERGELTFGEWIASVLYRTRLPFFAWSDPLPSVAYEARRIMAMAQAIAAKLMRLGRDRIRGRR